MLQLSKSRDDISKQTLNCLCYHGRTTKLINTTTCNPILKVKSEAFA